MMARASDVRSQWFPPAEAAPPPYAAKHRIADHVRAVIERLVGLDVATIDAQTLAEVEAASEDLRRRLEGLPDWRRQGSLAGAPLPEGSLVERSPVSGRGNALAFPLTYEFDGDTTRASAVFSQAYEGPPGGVHGGYVAAAFDELLGVAQMVTGLAGFTGTLQIRYHALTPIGRRIDYEAVAGERNGRKLTMCAKATVDGTLVAEAEGLFIAQVRVDDNAATFWSEE